VQSVVAQDGFYATSLGVDDTARNVGDVLFANPGDVWIGVTVGTGAELAPRQRLAHVPRALSARAVDSGTPNGATLTPDGRFLLRRTTATTCASVGEMVYNTTYNAVFVCDGSQYVAVYRKTVLLQSGVRRWIDGSSASSCEEYRRPGPSGSYTGDVGSGLYNINPGGTGAFDVYCDMTTDNGGWTLLFNLASNEGARRDYNDTAFWTAAGTGTGNPSGSMTEDHRSPAYDRLTTYTQVLIRAHDEGTTSYGHAIYPVQTAKLGQTFRTHLNGGANYALTDAPTARTGSVGAVRNTNRVQTLWGDVFLEHGGSLVLNKNSGWNAGTNLNRVATTTSNSDYAHTFAGLGGRHIEGSWGADYESAPISAYCAIENGYGGTAQATNNGQSNYVYQNDCITDNGATFVWLPVDHALFVR
jgi:hypothetical protein